MVAAHFVVGRIRDGAASFLTDDEKRAVIGYGPKGAAKGGASPFDVGAGSSQKFNPNHDGLGRFTAGDGGGVGADTAVGGDGNDRLVRPIDILKEDVLGGHTFERHVGKTEEYLKARVLGSRRNIPGLADYGELRAGSFTSLAAANKLVSSVVMEPQNQLKLNSFVERRLGYLLPILYLYPEQPFRSPSGYEAYAPNERSQPVIRTTNSVEVRVRRTDRDPKGYYVESAFPLNEE